ncbi:hypothetical protein IV203_010817 [Nitzschia inconspicua]|uniref:Uncharacterized protein n=1 Tax=Nitzschia inconspicua TaxID=303405 RepID=A0A9K3KXV2_9STRA|nr:hypothetical protein IV203_010817 [Nitzschia inconspicua]
MGNKLPTPPLHSTHDKNAASDSSVATDSDDASNGSDEVDLEAEGEEAALLSNGPAYYNMFLDLEEQECVKPKVKKRRGAKGVVYYQNEQGQLVVMPPTMSVWYGMYVAHHPDLDSPRFHKRFRRRFRSRMKHTKTI